MQFHDPVPAELAELLSFGLDAHNRAEGLVRQAFAFDCRDPAGRLEGGITANVAFGVLFINNLWTAPDLRGKGLGRRLMLAVEAEGRARGAETACVDTLSIQAPGFYPKLGYQEFGRVAGREGTLVIERIWFRKAL